ncbi:hypothetical protein [Micromonospora sp. NPDC005305]|uniref:hypothetical protein n=1 Tax=Micromonospora sp. NPDC005305 TaxID=3156875 RepID=UPI0033BF76CE
MLPFLDAVSRLLHDHGYAFEPEQLADVCAHHPDEVCALLAAAGTIAATSAQIAVLTDATNALAATRTHRGTRPSLRERLDRVGEALTTALARHDKATTALHRACESLIHACTDPVSIPNPSTAARNRQTGRDARP